MKTSLKVKSKKAGSRFIVRPYRRIPTWYTSYYMSGTLIGKGVVTNLSCRGMRLLGDHAMTPGTELSIQLELEEEKAPLKIERVVVRWVKEAEFGLDIVTIKPASFKRIAEILAKEAGAPR